MLTVTEDAKAKFADMLDQGDAPEGVAIRLVVQDGGLAVTPDQEKPGDTTFEHAGRTVLLVEDQIVNHLEDRTIDVDQSEEGEQLKIS